MIASSLQNSVTLKSCLNVQKRLFAQVALGGPLVKEEPLVLVESNKRSRTLTLNRPKQLNSINIPVINEIFPRLKAWEKSSNVDMIFFKGQGRALSSGADLKFIAGTIEEPARKFELDYFVDTLYDMMYTIGTMKTPLISFMDGVTAGTGCSMSSLGHFSVATEKTRLSMPETRIGHFADTGSSFYLSRLNGNMGKYIALTAKTLIAEDALFSGLATHFVPSERLGYLEDSLVNLYKPSLDDISRTIERYAIKPGHIPLSNTLHGENRRIIDRCFRFNNLNEILIALERDGSQFALETIDQITKGSPVGLALTLEHLQRASKLPLTKCLQMEHIGWQTSPYQPDFYHGIVSTLIKKQKPQWTIPTPSSVNIEEDIEVKYIYANARRPLNFSSNGGDCYFTKQCRKYGLPSEKEVQRVRFRNDFKTDDEVVSWFVKNRGDKYGVQQEVEEIIRSGHGGLNNMKTTGPLIA